MATVKESIMRKKSLTMPVSLMTKTLKKFEEKMESQLLCCVCLEVYIEPKILPCYHSFCLKCIEQLPRHSTKVSCPE